MKIPSRKSAKMATCFLFLCLSFFLAQPRRAEGGTAPAGLRVGTAFIDAKAETSKILATIEGRIGDRKLVETARSKLLLMDENRTRLLFALCDRIVADETSPGSSIALLLVTMLISLS
jgi:hypothetical protein